MVKLKELVDINIGKTPSRSNSLYWGVGSPWLSIADMAQGAKLYTTKEQITRLAIDECNCKLATKGTVLFSFKLSIGKVGVAAKDLYHNEAIASFPIKDESKLYAPYFLFALRNVDFSSRTDRAVMGATLNKSKLEELEIYLPPLLVQKNIANFLMEAESLCKKTEQMEHELNALAQNVFLDMFGHNQKMVKLGRYLDFITSGSRGWAQYYSLNGSRFLRSLDVRMNEIGSKEAVYVKAPNNKEAERARVRSGDILLTITGSQIGRVCWVPDEFGEAYVSQHVAILRLSHDLLPEFVSYFMSMESLGQKQISAAQYGQTKPGLNLEQIKSFTIPSVSIDQQKIFVDIMVKINALKVNNRVSLQSYKDQFNALMQRAFSGKLDLKKVA